MPDAVLRPCVSSGSILVAVSMFPPLTSTRNGVREVIVEQHHAGSHGGPERQEVQHKGKQTRVRPRISEARKADVAPRAKAYLHRTTHRHIHTCVCVCVTDAAIAGL